MASTAWPGPDRRNLIGSHQSRLDGPQKSTGAAKYAFDINRDKMLYAKVLQAPYAVAKILEIDTSEAESMPGVKAVLVEKDRNDNYVEVSYEGEMIATVAAETEEIATEALKKIKVTYDVSDAQMDDRNPELASGRDQTRDQGDVAAGMAEADVVSEGYYGNACITHCCLETHGQVCEFGADGHLYVWPSTQSVSGFAGGVQRAAETGVENIHVDCQYMGGGFGSKFAADQWGNICVTLAKMTGRPVKLMLDRDLDIKIAGHRPSAFANVKVGVKKDGTITALDAECWGSGGMQRFRMPPLPYVLRDIPNYRTVGKGIITNRGLTRAWRAPNHPQGCLISMAAYHDAANAIGMDPMEFLKKNIHLSGTPEDYLEELDIAAKMIDYKNKFHLDGQGPKEGSIRRGLGISIHEWGGQGHPSNAAVTIHPDGTVGVKVGTQDLGTGTRTTITMVAADTLGIPMDLVTAHIGENKYPESGASGGSTTIGGVSASTRDGATLALNALLEKVAPELGVQPAQLEAWDGKIQVIGDASKNMSWQDACKLLGQMAITKQGSNPPSDGTKLTTAGAAGCQIAEVSVDIETGVVTMENYVAVQDCGLIIDMKTAQSQVFGAMIMGITYALYEETIYDPKTGRMLNPDMEFYRLAGLGDVGTLKCHMMTGEKYESRGVIGLGEPPVISPGAAISNAVKNALGVRVAELPLTPDRVLQALNEGGAA